MTVSHSSHSPEEAHPAQPGCLPQDVSWFALGVRTGVTVLRGAGEPTESRGSGLQMGPGRGDSVWAYVG